MSRTKVLRRFASTLTGALLLLVLLAVSALPAAAAAPPSFAAQVTFATGTSPISVAAADLNGDGKPDLVAANYDSDNLSVLLNATAPGAAAPSFADQVTFATGIWPTSVAVADLNGDGRLDLAVTNDGSGTLSVLLNTAAPGAAVPSFADRVDFSTGSQPYMVAAADLNGDGRPDLVAANGNSDTLSVLLNTTAPGAAAPSFADRIDFATGSGPYAVAAADLNGDGRPDLVAANYASHTLSVLLNTTAPGAAVPSFADRVNFETDTNPTAVAAADFNGDGRPDLAVTNDGSDTLSVLLNNTAPGAAAPSFADRVDFATGSGPYAVAAADLNGDGRPDLVVMNLDSNTLSVLHNTTAPGAAVPSFAAGVDFAVGSGSCAVAAADLNGDGRPDLAAANCDSDTLSVLLNTTPMGAAPFTSTAATHLAMGDSPCSAVVADLNGDGKPDLITADWFSDAVSVLLNTTPPGAATSAFAPRASFGVCPTPTSMVAADLNGDGRPDLTTADYNGDTVSVLLNTTPPGADTPAFAAYVAFAVRAWPTAVTAADLNGDGRPDLVATSKSGDTVSVLLNTTAPGATAPSFAARADFATGYYPNSVAAADLNGDGRPDLVTASWSNNTVSVLLNITPPGAAAPSFAAQTSFAAGVYLHLVTAADLNGDGRPDLIAASQGSNGVSVLFNTTAPGATTPSFAAQSTFAVGTRPSSVTAADLNGDGRPDLAAANRDSSTLSVLLNTTPPGAAAPSFAAQVTLATGMGPVSVTAADLNGDGRADLATANWNIDTASVLLNTTVASLALTKTVSPSLVSPGRPVTYTLAFTNTNLFTATGVTITDTLPISITGISVASNVLITDTGAGPAYVWQVRDLTPGAGGIITLSGVLSPSQPLGVFTNTATIAGLYMEPGSATAEVTIVAPDIAVLGNGVLIPAGDTTPTTADDTDWGALVVGETISHTFTIRNDGTSPLTVSQVSLSGPAVADFSVDGIVTPAEVPPGGAVAFQVGFRPSVEGVRAATVTVTSDDPDEALYDWAIQGSGVVPGVRVAPSSLTLPAPGESGLFTLTLTSRPTVAVTIPLSAANGECNVPPAVQIQPDRWQSGVPVAVHGVDDGPDGPQVCLVQLLPVLSADIHYAGLDPDDVTVTVIDEYGVFLPVVIKIVR